MRTRWLSLGLLALCMSPAGAEEAPGGGGGASAGGTPAPAPQPSAPSFDAAKAEAEAEQRALERLGFKSKDDFDRHRKALEDAENAKLSDLEKHKKLYADADSARSKAEAKIEAHKAELKALRDQLELRDRFDTVGVKPTERAFVEVALRASEAEAKAAGKAHDDKAFFEKLRTERPYFFGDATEAQPANTGLRTSTNPGAHGAGAALPNGLTFDASKLSDEDFRKWRHENNH